MKHLCFAVVLILLSSLFVISGCGPKPGDPIVTYERGSITVPPLNTVEKSGRYTLFPGNGIVPLETVKLEKGDRYGFVSREGKVMGVYIIGGETRAVPLDAVFTTEYVWKLQEEK